jgi:hypothetical protein
VAYKTVTERDGLRCPHCLGKVASVRKRGHKGGWGFVCSNLDCYIFGGVYRKDQLKRVARDG